MQAPTTEMLLALRSPKSGWLATMICALDEAFKDADFSEHHRAMVNQILERGEIATAVVNAAEERLGHFEASVAQAQSSLISSVANAVTAAHPGRAQLTLVSNAA